VRAILRIGIIAALSAAAGCGGPPSLVPVGGVVTIDGKAYEGVRVYFTPQTEVPAKSFASRFAIGISDKDGKYTLKGTYGEGVEVGEYKVTFSRVVARSGKADTDPNRKPEESGAKESLSPEFTDIKKTKFTAVVSNSNREFAFDLKTK
jgi:hypothetical protein